MSRQRQHCALQESWHLRFHSGWQRTFSRLSLEKSMKADRPFLGASARTQLRQEEPEGLQSVCFSKERLSGTPSCKPCMVPLQCHFSLERTVPVQNAPPNRLT